MGAVCRFREGLCDTVPRKMLFKVLAHLGLPPQRVDIVQLFHENNVSLPGSGPTR